jgi:ribosome-associated protein
MTLDEKLALVKQTLDDLKAQDIQPLDVRGMSCVTDFMLVVTATSNTHARALANRVVEKIKEIGEMPMGIEGLDEAKWVLVDLGNLVVHIMLMDTRVHYSLETLWSMESKDRPQASHC